MQIATTQAKPTALGGDGSDTVVLPGGIYTLVGGSGEDDNSSGDLDVTDDLSIEGEGREHDHYPGRRVFSFRRQMRGLRGSCIAHFFRGRGRCGQRHDSLWESAGWQ